MYLNIKLIELIWSFFLKKKQDEESIETEQTSPKKKTAVKANRLRKKSEAEKLQEEASGVNIFIFFFS